MAFPGGRGGGGKGRPAGGGGGYEARPGKGPPSRGGRPPVRPEREVNERRAQELVARAGIPLDRARRVVAGVENLTDVIEDLAFRARVDALISRHDLNRALATQVELGQADLDTILLKRRLDEELARSRDRSVLDAFVGKELALGVHGHKVVRARIDAVDKYEVDLTDLDVGEARRVHKLEIKYAYAPDDYKRIKKGLDHDEERRRREIAPIPRPQDRYACSDRRIGAAWHAHVPVRITTLEGERFTGEVTWIARYEIGLRIKDHEVVVFRHAIDLFEELPRNDKK